MPNVNWGISANAVDKFDREAQFKPYLGKVPVNGAYVWRLYRLQFAAGTADKYPQLRIGLELQPQSKAEDKYKGYRLMTFRSVADHTPFAYVPFLDAIGVSANDFTSRTKADSEGNIQRIGNWRNDDKQLLVAVLKDDKDQDGKPRKDIGYIGSADELADEGDDEPDDDDFDDDEEYADDDEDDASSDEVEDYYDYDD